MSTATATAPQTPPAAAPVSPVEYVRALPPEDKEDVLIALLRDLIAFRGGKGLIPVESPEGEWLGYYVPPAAAKALSDQMWAEMPPAVREAFGRPVKNLDNCISAEEMLDLLNPGAGSSPP